MPQYINAITPAKADYMWYAQELYLYCFEGKLILEVNREKQKRKLLLSHCIVSYSL